MKIFKRIVVAFVLCLAIVGAYALLKKAPQLNVPAEDVDYLQDVGISASKMASEEGLSGAHGNVIGAPPLVATSAISSSNQGSNAPPSSFGISAPTFDANSVALPFGETNETPAFASTEAPPFVSATPAATIAAPFIPPATIPIQSPQPAPLQPPPMVMPPLIPMTSAPPQSPPPEQPLAWDGPTTEVIFIPSTSLADPWGVSGILETKLEPTSIPVPTQTFSATIPTPTLISAPTQAFVPTVNPLLETTMSTELVDSATSPIVPSPVSGTHETKLTDKVVDSGVRIKRLPVSTEEMPILQTEREKKNVLLAASVPPVPQTRIVEVSPTESPKQLYQKSSLVSEEKYPPFRTNDYRQTSIRKDVIFAPSASSTREEQPVISFAQQKPMVKEPLPLAAPIVPHPVQTAPPISKQKRAETPEIEVIPFANTDPTTKSTTFSVAESIPATSSAIRESLDRFVKAQVLLVESGDPIRIRNAFIQLSKLYEHPELNDVEKTFMTPLLDRLALNVIYSRNVHILEPPYTIKLGDSIDSIAHSFEISPALLMKINGLTGARPLEPGTELKIVIGHFDAKISVKHRELTLILGGLYAGRFAVGLGERVENLRGEFYVSSKTDTWNEKSLTLNNGVTFYGILDDRLQPDDPQPTTVRFTKQDAKELFDILIERSVVIFED